jgi:hypothetical protein
MTPPSAYGPYIKSGISIMVYMTAFEQWCYQAERGTMYSRGTVQADNRIDAWNKAFEAARASMWTIEEILEREA